MQYYLWIEGKEHGPYTEPQIREAVAAGDINESTPLRNTEGAWGSVKDLISSTSLKFSAPRPTRSPSVCLQEIRSQTCYRALRVVINVSAALAFLWVAATPTYFFRGSDFSLGTVAVSVGMIAIGLLFVIAARQSALLIVDIADTLIANRADRIS